MNRVPLRSTVVETGDCVDDADEISDNESLHYYYTGDPENDVLRNNEIVSMFQSLQSGAIIPLDRIKSLQFSKMLNDNAIATLRNHFGDTRNSPFQLKSLRIIENTKITSNSAENLSSIVHSQLPFLIELDLSKNPSLFTLNNFTLLLVTLYSRDCHVERLNLSHNSIGREIKHISRLLQNNQSVQHLNLSHNYLGPRQMMYPEGGLYNGLYNNQTLLSLDLSSNLLKDNGVRKIMNALDTGHGSISILKELYISNNSIGCICIGDKSISESLSRNRSLEKLDLSDNMINAIGGNNLRLALQLNHTLKVINLAGNNLCEVGNKNDGLHLIADGLSHTNHSNCQSTLIRLDLGMIMMRDEGAIAISDMISNNKTLEILNLSNNSIQSDGMNAILKALPDNTSIRELWLHCNNIKDETNLVLYVSNMKLCKLSVLTYEGNDFTADQLKNIESAFHYHNNMKTWLGTFLESVQKNNVRDIRLLDSEVIYGDRELREIANHLVKHPIQLTTVRLDGGNVTNIGISHFANNVLGNADKRLRLLYLYCNNLTRLHTDGVQSIARCLHIPTCSLLGLTLCHCNIGPDGATEIARYIKSNQTLTLLCLQSNHIADIGAKHIFAAVLDPPHPTLKILNLSNNRLTDNALEGLGRFNRLEEVLLNKNDISDRGVLDICKAVMDSTSIIFLNLENNPEITNRGIQTLHSYLPDPFVLNC